MKVTEDSAAPLLCLLLWAELMAHSTSGPASSPAFCGASKSMLYQVDRLIRLSRKLHDLSEEEVLNMASTEPRLDGLPHLQHSAEYFASPQVNQSLAQLYLQTQSFGQHLDWLKLAKEHFGLPSQSAESSSRRLLQLARLLNASLRQMDPPVPSPPPPPSFPVVSSSFEALQISVEISDQLRVFCYWTKRLLRYLQRLYRCPRH